MKIDAMGIDKSTGEVVLTISDHLGWDDTRAHLQMLERKINTYLGFVLSGQLADNMPASAGRELRVSLVHQFDPPPSIAALLAALRSDLAGKGFAFSWGPLPKDY